MDHSKLYDLLRSNDFSSKKIVDSLAKNLDTVSKIAKQTTKQEFIAAMNGTMPTVKLSPAEMEVLKGGKPLAALIESVVQWWHDTFHG